jgi:hypothetical protein
MALAGFINNIYVWIGGTFLFFILFLIEFGILMFLGLKTHAIMELKAFIRKLPIGLFFQDNRYCEWKIVKPEAGIIEDKKYGSYLINEKGSYVDRQTKAILLPFDANIATSINMHAAKVSDDLKTLITDEKQLNELRLALANEQLNDKSIDTLKQSINVGSIKSMLNAMLPHNITAKVNMMVAQKMQGWNKINYWEIGLLFMAVFGAIIMGVVIIKTMVK